jgi:uncharacterized Zn finger protein (UPF0148 family)
MLEQLTCPSCSAPLSHDLFATGERIVDCPYCGNAMQAPEDRQAKLKAVLGALAESGFMGATTGNVTTGAKVSTNVKTTVSVVSLSPGDKVDVQEQINKALEGFNITLPAGATAVTITSGSGGETQQTTSKTFDNIDDALGDMKTELGKMADSLQPGAAKEKDSSEKPAKKSFWKRLRGK